LSGFVSAERDGYFVCCQISIMSVTYMQINFSSILCAVFIALLMAFAPLPRAVAEVTYTKQTKWHGFDQFHFQCAGRDAYLVVPPQTLPARPWIWRARFPDFHAEMDIELVRAGYHLAYFDVANQFGCPSIIDKANEFYRLVVEQHDLNPKPVLEGVSRGGLFVYNWAAANPNRVACIYCDTPVLDFRSWPGGKGTGRGSAAAWRECLAAYGLTAEQAATFNQRPLDHANIIAKARIPILHIVSENDRVVPPAENTYLLRDELRKFGHDMEIISVPGGTEKSYGHHFDHPEPARVVDFIRRYGEKTANNDSQ
jgi:sialidase-1